MYATQQEALAAIRALPGYIPGSLTETPRSTGPESSQDLATVTEGRWWTYLQKPPSSQAAKTREALLTRTYSTNTETNSQEDLSWGLALPVVSETPEGHPLTIQSFGGPGEFYPFCFSMALSAPRGGGEPVKADKSAWDESDGGEPAYYRTTEHHYLTAQVGFQNIVACWARCNEGDFVDFSVEAPVAFGPSGIPTAWAQVASFGEGLQIFGTNAAGTYYPPNQSPSLSWIPAGCRMRLDFYQKNPADPWLVGAKGPFVELDFLCQRLRSEVA